MPTTRSSKRSSETFQILEAPKRSRKNQSSLSHASVAQSGILRIFPNTQESLPVSSIPTQLRPRYVSIGTQTDDVVMLTPKQAADLEQIAVSNSNQKRSREDDSEDDHRSKRAMLTPQPRPDRTLWMFPSAASVNAPRTAPAKSLASPSIRRPRGLISRTPQTRRRIGAAGEPMKTPRMIAPVEVDDTETHVAKNHDEKAAHEDKENEPESTTFTPKPAQSSLFGSMRGFAATGLNFISHLSPRRASTKPSSPSSTASRVRSSANQPTVEEDNQETTPEKEPLYPKLNDEYDTTTESPSAQRSQRHSPTAPGMYDHLHIYTADNIPRERLRFPPRAPAPPDPLEMMKGNHPNVPEAHLRRIVEKRQREREEREKELGISANSRPIVKAPLFGPDSHFARGTIDPTLFLEKPLCLYSDEELRDSPRKRKYDTVDATLSDAEGGTDTQDGPSTAADTTETNEVDSEDPFLETPKAKKQRTTAPAQPATPRSAMKKVGDFGASVGRSSRSVLFNTNPVSGSRGLRAHYGPAGQYRGSTFADSSPPGRRDDSTLSTLDYSDIISPSTKLNTLANTNAPAGYDAMVQLERNLGANIPEIDFSVRDPSNSTWRPSISNPRPGSFRVPYLDEEDEDMEDDQESSAQTNTTEKTPAQPSTPRMSHAELPGASSSVASSINPDSILFESTELALEKARSAAQKYKPKDSSRLSEVSQAISRSPSPDTHDLNTIHESNNDSSTPRQRTTAPAVRPLGAPPQPFVAPPLDNTNVGEDGMTDREREHQFDDWAAGIDWPAPQTYEEAGICTKEIGDLIRKNWTTGDDRRSEEFWHREFEMIEREQLEAKKLGKTLGFITGMEGAFMEGIVV